jgi:alpha-tubulin suppressor-like RCC1 family protein
MTGGPALPARARSATTPRPAPAFVVLTGALVLALALAACDDPVAPPEPEPPVGEPFYGVAVALAGSGACALDTDGALHCWGLGPADAAGDSLLFQPWAAPVPGAPALDTVAGGVVHYCGIAAGDGAAGGAAGAGGAEAGTGAGVAYCWGDGARGRLGTGTMVDAVAPSPVDWDGQFSVVAPGGGHTCAVSPADTLGAAGGPASNLFCWGRAENGELGDATFADRAEPGRVGWAHHYVDVAAGRHHACGLDRGGVVRCWGWNHYGQLGVGHTIGLGLPEGVPSEVLFTAVAAGDRHSCAIAEDGTAWCWGRGAEGQLGTGDTDGSSLPRPVAGGLRFTALSAGAAHTCGVTADGAAYCWGERRYGRLGDGLAFGVALEPSRVAGDLRFRALAAGALNSCGVTEDEAVYCWGFGGFGQLGAGQLTNALEPVPVRHVQETDA